MDLIEKLVESIVGRVPRSATEVISSNPERILLLPFSSPKSHRNASQRVRYTIAKREKINTLAGILASQHRQLEAIHNGFPLPPTAITCYQLRMFSLKLIIDDLRNPLKQFLPGATVVLIVMFLLRGVSGSVQAIKLQIVTLATSFLGGDDGMIGVLLHTIPLALAASVATFAIARRMIRFESPLSILALALIVILGASIGGFLRQFAPYPESQPQPPLIAVSASSQTVEPGHSLGNISIGIRSQKLPLDLASVMNHTTVRQLPVRHESSIEQLRQIDWLAQPDFSKPPPSDIEPLALVPKASGVIGVAAKAINQLLAYLVAYQPRLFLAAVITGSWFGWSWHRRLQKLTEYAADRCKSNKNNERESPRSA